MKAPSWEAGPRDDAPDPHPREWVRHRFHANGADYRPVHFPPPGPYWCSGYAGDDSYSVIIAYLPPGEPVTNWWPEADEIDSDPASEIVYTDRFPRPKWYTEEVEEMAKKWPRTTTRGDA